MLIRKTIVIFIMTAVAITPLVSYFSTVSSADYEDIKNTSADNVIAIRVARHSAEGGYWSTFEYILNGYEWMIGNKTYKIYTSIITDDDIFNGKLTTENYDLLVFPYSDAMKEMEKRFYPSIRNRIWKNKITDFVKAGGGYVGYCAPAITATGLNGKPETLLSKVVDDFNFEISGVELIFNSGIPVLSQLTGKPEKIGPIAYLWYSGAYIPLDVTVNNSNPIFDDLLECKRRISWCGGPAFELPEDPVFNVSVLAYFPEEEMSDNESTQIHAWKYTGGIRGFVKGFIKSGGSSCGFIPGFLSYATDWKKTDKIIETNFANKPFMTMETYPNINKGRVVLCGGHPEAIVYWGGHIQEVEDTNYNSLSKGFHYFVNVTPFDETPEDEFTYNWWIVRRHVAWASKKVPNCDLPPVYGYSQVEDLASYDQSSCFTIEGNIELSIPFSLYYLPCTISSNLSLSLHYRYSDDGLSNWSNWTLYETDVDGSDGWSWEFNASDVNGSGFYQFYSIKKVEYHCDEEVYKIVEMAPPGPDAIARVVD
jgi:hypothetical protein